MDIAKDTSTKCGETKMKKIVVAIMIFVLCILVLQFGQDVKVNTSIRVIGENESREYLKITANRLWIIDKTGFAQEILERRIENSYKNIYFTDTYSDKMEVEVYRNKLAWKMKQQDFSIVYEYNYPDGYSFTIQ